MSGADNKKQIQSNEPIFPLWFMVKRFISEFSVAEKTDEKGTKSTYWQCFGEYILLADLFVFIRPVQVHSLYFRPFQLVAAVVVAVADAFAGFEAVPFDGRDPRIVSCRSIKLARQ